MNTWKEFSVSIPRNWTGKDIELVQHSFELSKNLHAHQKRQSGELYFNHPVRVAQELLSIKLDAYCIAAGLLHDVVEDKLIPLQEIEQRFGTEVAFLISGVTKVDKIKYRGMERSLESLRKMFLAIAEDVRVVLIKLTDRLDNIKTLGALRYDKQQRIARETLELYAPLAYRLGMYELSSKLEDLAFKYVYPDDYEWIVRETKTAIPERQAYLRRLVPIVRADFEREKLRTIDIQTRAKHYYSLYKKLLRNGMDWGKIYDLVAMRIIVPEITDCYSALGIIHAKWKPVPGRIKDYIALPKPNGYRSLHTTVFCVDKKLTEFQIRTPEMNEEAEFGIAAHWVWHEAGKPKAGVRADEQKIAWVKQLRKWQEEIEASSHEEEFENLKIDFFKNRIFVLTPKGDVIDLPEKATPIDFAYHVHSEIGDQMTGAKINGKMVPFDYSLKSGDVVEILTQKNKKPSPDWLELVKTSMARGHIKRALRDKKRSFLKLGEQKENRMKICAKDRIGLLRDISSVFANMKVSIANVATTSKTKTHHFITISFKPNKKVSAQKLITQLRKVPNVESIEAL